MSVTGIIDGLPILDYVRDPAPAPSLSASTAHVLLTQSPAHARLRSARLNPDWEPDAMDPKQIVGTVAHAILLEGDRSRVVVIEAEDWRKKDAQAARDEALATGKLPILEARMEDVEAMVEAARGQIAASELPDAFTGGHAERTMIWADADGVTWRSRPDWCDDESLVYVDLKTTGASAQPDAWTRGPLQSYEFDLQGALALWGATALLGPADRKFVFAVLETEPPYALSLVGLDPYYIQFAERKLDRAAKTWAACLAADAWPGYPSRIAWASPPEWAVARWEERQTFAVPEDEGVEAL